MGGALRRRAPHEKSDVVREALQRYLEDTEDGQKWGSFSIVLSFHFRSIFIMDAITKDLPPIFIMFCMTGIIVSILVIVGYVGW